MYSVVLFKYFYNNRTSCSSYYIICIVRCEFESWEMRQKVVRGKRTDTFSRLTVFTIYGITIWTWDLDPYKKSAFFCNDSNLMSKSLYYTYILFALIGYMLFYPFTTFYHVFQNLNSKPLPNKKFKLIPIIPIPLNEG